MNDIDEVAPEIATDQQKGTTAPHKKKENPQQTEYDQFIKELEQFSTTEDKLSCIIAFMEKSLMEGAIPHFKSFWDARGLCLPLFKENINAAVRSQLWTKFSELSKEARHRKESLDKESSFAVEQIELAIQALEKEIETVDSKALEDRSQHPLHFPQAMKQTQPFFIERQKHLNLFNAHASRIHSLRKELIKTDMRIRLKNGFFQRLSIVGDKVFQPRKELIQEISQEFQSEVDRFLNRYFNESDQKAPFHILREEIKLFQGVAKELTLSTTTFTKTRTQLSECWDKLRNEEREHKKEQLQKKQEFQQNADELSQQFAALKAQWEEGTLSIQDASKKVDESAQQMRRVELGWDQVKELRETLNNIRQSIQSKQQQEDDFRKKKDQEQQQQKKEQYDTLRSKIDHLTKNHTSLQMNELIENRDALLKEIQEKAISKKEKTELERLLKPLKDIIQDKKEQELLALSDDDRQSLQQLREILSQRKARRQEIKNQLEIYRKESGSSALDFEKAMNLNVLINEEKERLEKANQGIVEIESKLVELQQKIKR